MTGVLRLLALATPLGLFACGPVTYVSRVTFGATGEVAQARTGNAEKMAPYEYTIAAEYLAKSKELAGYARFHDANNFAKRSKDMAVKSRDVTSRREKKDELPIYVPGENMYINKDGAVKRGKPTDPNQASDDEKPPLGDLDAEKPPLGDAAGSKGAKKGGGR